MTKQYKYDAFISYRHTELDKFAAQTLHRQLESFRLPASISKHRQGERTRINRVFRDKDELPLTDNLEDPILQALSSSEFLIVICSPRLKESLWCKKEIETFISMHGREKVLAVLIEGEPAESFPEELLYREETVTEEDSTTRIERIPIEPLAADIRGKNRWAMKKALRTEMLRLLAPMFSLNYDDLRQRHRERRLKRILAASLSIGTVCLAFGTISTAMALRIQSQKTQIEAQSAEILKQNEEISHQNEEIRQQNEAIKQQNEALLTNQAVTLSQEALRQLDAGDRMGAVQTAITALTTYQGNELPYTPEAQFALTQSLCVYDNGYFIKPLYQMETSGIINYMDVSENGEILVTYDNTQCLTLWEVGTGTKLGEIRDVDSMDENDFLLQGNDRLVYINDERRAVVYDISTGKSTRILDYTYAGNVYGDPGGKRLVLTVLGGFWVLDGETYEEIEYYSGMFPYCINVSRDGNYLAFLEEDDENNMWLQHWNLETGAKYPVMNVGTRLLKYICYHGDVAYMVLNYSGLDFAYFEVTVKAFRIETGEQLWEYRVLDSFGDRILLPSAEGAENLVVSLNDEARLLSMKDGTEIGRASYGSSAVGWGVYLESNYFMLFTRSGEYHMMDGTNALDYDRSDAFLSHSQNVREFRVVSDGFLLLPFQDNRVTYYNFSRGDLTVYDGNAQRPEAENYSSSWEAIEKAEELGLPGAPLVSRLFYDQEKSRAFVSYRDGRLEIYNTADMSLLSTVTGLDDEMIRYAGTDSQENIYLAGYSLGYMLNSEYQPLAAIEGLVCVDRENNCVIMKNSREDPQYQLPIYTVEELLAMARESVL